MKQLLVFCKAGPAVPVHLHLTEHEAGLLKKAIERQMGLPDQVSDSQWPELAKKITAQIEASYERFFGQGLV